MSKERSLQVVKDAKSAHELAVEEHARKMEGLKVPPDWLDDRARQKWDQFIGEALEHEWVTEPELDTFANYCQTVSDVERLTLEVREEGETLTSKRYGAKRNPKTLLLREAHDRLHKVTQALGFTPSTRNRVKRKTNTGPNPFDQLGRL